MIIGTCGFSWSGSSAVTDLLMEYEETQVYKPEFPIAYYPDGIEDLDFHLNTQCAKFNSSTIAISRFRKTANTLLGKDTGGAIEKLTEEYLNKLVQVKWNGYALQLCDQKGPIERVIAKNIYYHLIVKRMNADLVREKKIYPMMNMELSIKPDHFIESTQAYLEEILNCVGLDIDRKIVLDQPFPGNNPENCMRYFKDAKAIIVDRDPRDLYLIVKKYFKNRCFQYPNTPIEFVEYYKAMHRCLEKARNNQDILFIQFEELVYEYEDTVKKIEDFLNINKHKDRQKIFIPNMSKVNTRLFEKSNEFEEDIRYISNQLSEYLYDYSNVKEALTEGELFDDNEMTKSYDHRGRRKNM